MFLFTLVSAQDFQDITVGATQWGAWGEWKFCPNGGFINGFRLKIEADQGGSGDDTCMNGIQFVCNTEDRRSLSLEGSTSAVGPWGDWGSWHVCPQDHLMAGVEFFSEKALCCGQDDTAANNMHILCKQRGGSGESWLKNIINGDHHDGLYGHSTSTELRRCPEGWAVNGFRTKVENEQGSGDDTALNKLGFECTPASQCAAVVLSNVEADPVDISDPKVTPKSIDIRNHNNCENSVPFDWALSSTDSRSVEFQDSYTLDQTISSTFGQSIGSSLEVSVSGGIGLGFEAGVTAGLTFDTSWESTMESSSSKMTGTVTANTIEKTDVFEIQIPPFSKFMMQAQYTEVTADDVKFTATATCFAVIDADGKPAHEISSKQVSGTWEGTSVSQTTFKVVNLSNECPRANVCECAGVSSITGIGGGCATVFGASARGTWCYIVRGACDEEASSGASGEIGEIGGFFSVDFGLGSEDFQWSSIPCQGSRRRSDLDALNRLVEQASS